MAKKISVSRKAVAPGKGSRINMGGMPKTPRNPRQQTNKSVASAPAKKRFGK